MKYNIKVHHHCIFMSVGMNVAKVYFPLSLKYILWQRYNQDRSHGDLVAAIIWVPYALSPLHFAVTLYSVCWRSYTRYAYVYWCSPVLWYDHSPSLAETWHFLALTQDKMKRWCARLTYLYYFIKIIPKERIYWFFSSELLWMNLQL